MQTLGGLRLAVPLGNLALRSSIRGVAAARLNLSLPVFPPRSASREGLETLVGRVVAAVGKGRRHFLNSAVVGWHLEVFHRRSAADSIVDLRVCKRSFLLHHYLMSRMNGPVHTAGNASIPGMLTVHVTLKTLRIESNVLHVLRSTHVVLDSDTIFGAVATRRFCVE